MQLSDDTSVADSLVSGKLLFARRDCSRVGFDSRASNMLRRCLFLTDRFAVTRRIVTVRRRSLHHTRASDQRIVRGSQSAISGKIISSTVVATMASMRMLQPL